VAELEQTEGLRVLDRRELESVLQELRHASSTAFDQAARLRLGELLPAGLLLSGDTIPFGDEQRLHLRLIDTESGEIIGTFARVSKPDASPEPLCRDLAAEILDRIRKKTPVTAKVRWADGEDLTVQAGSLHGAYAGMPVELFRRETAGDTGAPPEETPLGSAEVVSVGEVASILRPSWEGEAPAASARHLWARERPLENR
jgi:hypothetical protein